MEAPQTHIYEFGRFRLDATKRLLIKDAGEVVPLMPKAFDTLLYLVRNGGRIIKKDELLNGVWADAFVEENNLSQNISILRKVLGEKRGEHRYIATVPGHGYKFVAEIHRICEENAAEAEEKTRTGDSAVAADQDKKDERRRANYRIPLAAGSILLLALILIFYSWWPGTAKRSGVKSVAVLPFKPLVKDSGDEALEMGMADTLIARLAGNREILVRPLGSVRRFTDPEQNPQNVGRELGVETVLDGSIQRWGDKIRVNVHLLRTADGTTLWTGTYDEQFTDVFAVQDAISNKVAAALTVQFVGNGNASDGRGTENFEAYRLYLQGRYHALKLTPSEVNRGIEFYRRAIDADPLYALAYAGLAEAYRTLPINSDIAPDDAFPKAQAAVAKALEIDQSLAEAHIVSGWIASWYEHDWNKAEAEFKRALELRPNSSEAFRGSAHLLSQLGRHDEAVANMKRARELDPLSLSINALEGQILFYAGRDDEAVERLNKTLEIDSNFWIAHINLAKIYIERKQFDEALVHLKKSEESSGGNTETISLRGYAMAKAGRREEAQTALEELRSASKQRFVPPYNIALIYNGLGQSDDSLNWLEKALQERDVRMTLLKIDPKWNNLRSEPRFREMIRQMGFPETN